MQLQRWVVLGVLALVPVVRAASSDTFSLPKFLLLVVALVALAGSGATLGIDRLRASGKGTTTPAQSWLRDPWVITALALLAVLTLSTLSSDALLPSMMGAYRRWGGLLLGVSTIVVGLVVAIRFRVDGVRLIGRIIAITTVLAALHGLLQDLELVDSNFTATGKAVYANLGNSNFLAAYLAIGLPFVVLEAVETTVLWRRLVIAGAAILTIVTLVLTSALQGPVALGAGVTAGLAAVLWHVRRHVAQGLVGVLGLSTLLGALGLMSVGPLAALGGLRTFELRVHYWKAAVAMFADHPLLGVGIGRFGAFFRDARTLAAAQQLPTDLEVDGAHNVLLDALATGGPLTLLLLIGAWALVFVAIARLVARERERGLTSALVAAWVAYLAQAMVSLDTPPLLLLGWVIPACVIALDRAGEETAGRVHTKRKRGQRSRHRRMDPVLATGAVVTAVLVLLTAIGAIQWLAADRSLEASVAARRVGGDALPAALEHSAEALGGPVDLPEYQLNRAETLVTVGQQQAALDAYARTVATDNRLLRAIVGQARALSGSGQLEAAAAAWDHVLDVEPNLAPLYAESSRVLLDLGRADEAVERARVGTEIDDQDAKSWAALGLALHDLGQDAGALVALERAEALGTTDEEATQLLADLRS